MSFFSLFFLTIHCHFGLYKHKVFEKSYMSNIVEVKMILQFMYDIILFHKYVKMCIKHWVVYWRFFLYFDRKIMRLWLSPSIHKAMSYFLTHWGWHFQVHFLEWLILNFKTNFIEICSFGSNWQYGGIGADNGLALNRRQAIIWTNVDMLYWRIYASLGLNELTHWHIYHLSAHQYEKQNFL